MPNVTASVSKLAGSWAMTLADGALSDSNMANVLDVAFAKEGQSFSTQPSIFAAPSLRGA